MFREPRRCEVWSDIEVMEWRSGRWNGVDGFREFRSGVMDMVEVWSGVEWGGVA